MLPFMARAGKLRKRWGPPRPHRFGCRDARRTKWGYLPRETKATDGTFGEVAQTIPPIIRSWGRSGRVLAEPDACEHGSGFISPRSTNFTLWISILCPKSFEGFQGELFQKFPLARPPHPPDKPKFEAVRQTPPASERFASDAGGYSYRFNYFNTFLHHVRFPQ